MISNKTKKIVLAKDSKYCNTFISKFIGLMFSKKRDSYGLIFPLDKPIRVSMHMMFVFYPIDIAFLDQNKKVIELKKNMKPFTFYRTENPVSYVIELPVNSKVAIGDQIEI